MLAAAAATRSRAARGALPAGALRRKRGDPPPSRLLPGRAPDLGAAGEEGERDPRGERPPHARDEKPVSVGRKIRPDVHARRADRGRAARLNIHERELSRREIFEEVLVMRVADQVLERRHLGALARRFFHDRPGRNRHGRRRGCAAGRNGPRDEPAIPGPDERPPQHVVQPDPGNRVRGARRGGADPELDSVIEVAREREALPVGRPERRADPGAVRQRHARRGRSVVFLDRNPRRAPDAPPAAHRGIDPDASDAEHGTSEERDRRIVLDVHEKQGVMRRARERLRRRPGVDRFDDLFRRQLIDALGAARKRRAEHRQGHQRSSRGSLYRHKHLSLHRQGICRPFSQGIAVPQ